MLQERNHRLRGLSLVVLVQRQQLGAAFVDAISAQQAVRVARVLAGQRVGQLQDVQGAQRDVGGVANRRGDDVQRALRIMLRSGRIVCGGQGCCERCAQ